MYFIIRSNYLIIHSGENYSLLFVFVYLFVAQIVRCLKINAFTVNRNVMHLKLSRHKQENFCVQRQRIIRTVKICEETHSFG